MKTYKTKEDFINTKIKVTPEQSKELQEYLFSLGITWFLNYNNNVVLYKEHFLFITSNLYLKYSNRLNNFNDAHEKEIFYDDIFPLTMPKYWRVKNDGSQLFKNTVIEDINSNDKDRWNSLNIDYYYGYDDDWGILKYGYRSTYIPTELTLNQYLHLTNRDEFGNKINNSIMKITEKDLIGDIEGFPIEIVEKMLERQVQLGNKEDIKVFQKNKNSDCKHKGFTWAYTEEGSEFWTDLIWAKNFDIFFKKYSKSTMPKRGDKILVRYDAFHPWSEKIFISYIDGSKSPVVCVDNKNNEKLFLEGKKFDTYNWSQYKLIPKEEIVELTLQDISKGKGIGVPSHLIRIKE